MSDFPRWILSGLFGLLGSWIIILNYSMVISWYRHRRHSSRIPLLGGLCLMAGMLASPLPGVTRYAWVPLVIDLGCHDKKIAADAVAPIVLHYLDTGRELNVEIDDELQAALTREMSKCNRTR